MKNMLFIILAVSIVQSSYAQKDLRTLIEAEQHFAAYAIEHNLKEAFLKFMDENAVVFNQGKPRNAKEVWTANAPSSDRMLWKPLFAGVSASGDFGFTSGPWELRKTMKDTSIFSGQFTTVWHKVSGEWKFLLDMGIVFRPSGYEDKRKIETVPVGTSSAISASDTAFSMESAFIKQFNLAGKETYRGVIHRDALFSINGHTPFYKEPHVREALQLIPDGTQFTFLKGGMSDSRDIAYCYGFVKYKDKEENYLRIWQHEAGGWKIVVQVLR